MEHFDIVHAADPRYRGGTTAALRGEIIGAARWSLKVGLLPYLGPRTNVVSGFEPRTTAAIQKAGVPLLPADGHVSCDILLAHHPAVFEFLPASPVAIRPGRVVCVLHHPLFDGQQRAQYNIHHIARSLQAAYAAPVVFAPISPIIRAQAQNSGVPAGWLLKHDLCNLIDEQEWPERVRPAPRSHAVIGRHSRAHPMKWPDSAEEILAAYPTAKQFGIQILGEPTLPDDMQIPPNWTIRPFTETGVSDYLRGLDFYVYFHSPRWVEAFGLAIAEAMLTGLVTVLPPTFEPIFGDGAVYAEPKDVQGVLEHFMARPDEYARQSRAARRVILSRYAVAGYGSRMARLYGDLDLVPPKAIAGAAASDPVQAVPSPPVVVAPGPKRLLMVAGNGIGLGHITRLMAISCRFPAWVQPMFLTLSPGTQLVREAGFSADYIPSHSKSGVTSASWNEAFALELLAAIDASDAAMVVFDGSGPFPGIVRVMALRPDIAWVWIRRGLWQPHQRLNPETQHLFDMVIEPGELAGDEDGGATAHLPQVERVGPILLSDPAERADRATAAAWLGVDPTKPTVAIQLGSQSNFNMEPLRLALLAAMLPHPVNVIEIENPLAAPTPGNPCGRRIFPLFPMSKAIDLLITAPGYNAFHESVYGGIPTIFVPNEAPEMDDQLLRAAFARSAGLGMMMTVADAPRAAECVAHGLSAGFAATVRQRSELLDYENGAVAAARLITDFLISVRTDRRLHALLPRHREFG